MSRQRENQAICQSFVVLVCFSLVSTQLLDYQDCMNCAQLFRSQGCTNEPSFLCQLIAFKLLFTLGHQRMCFQRPCVGYGQENTHTCTEVFKCRSRTIDVDGVCDGIDICCRNDGLIDDDS